MTVITIRELFKARAHIGHKTRRWNPKMWPYIYAISNKVHIIDLVKTSKLLTDAHQYVYKAAKNHKKFLFIGTKPSAAPIIQEQAKKM